jgi:hypothetical protein
VWIPLVHDAEGRPRQVVEYAEGSA